MSTVGTGNRAESAVAAYLKAKGWLLLDQNWRTPKCEIDIIAKHSGALYFCEVKYRKSFGQGQGLEYITPGKLKQMSYAAEVWVRLNGWRGPYQLCAAEVSGPDFKVTALVTDIYTS